MQTWSRPLSASEIQSLYAGTVPRAGLTGEYRMDEGAGTTVHDSARSDDGRPVSGTWQQGSGPVGMNTGTSGGCC